jgi:hypothetical protein
MDLSWECDALAGAVSKGGMYQSVFLIGPLINYGYKAFIAFSGYLPHVEWSGYEQQAKELSRQAFRDIMPTQHDPTGYQALRIANMGYWIVATLFIMGASIFIIRRIVRYIKQK